jgi:hypothetical protein
MGSSKGCPHLCNFPRFATNRLFQGAVLVLFLGISAIGTDRAYGALEEAQGDAVLEYETFREALQECSGGR